MEVRVTIVFTHKEVHCLLLIQFRAIASSVICAVSNRIWKRPKVQRNDNLLESCTVCGLYQKFY